MTDSVRPTCEAWTNNVDSKRKQDFITSYGFAMGDHERAKRKVTALKKGERITFQWTFENTASTCGAPAQPPDGYEYNEELGECVPIDPFDELAESFKEIYAVPDCGHVSFRSSFLIIRV